MRQIKFLILALALMPAISSAADCRSFLKGYTEWEMKVKGQMIPKVSYFEIQSWSPDSQFDGIVLAAGSKAKRPVLEVEFRDDKNLKVKAESFLNAKPFERDPNLQHFADFKPKKFFNFDSEGKFELRLKDGDTVLCQETYPLLLGD